MRNIVPKQINSNLKFVYSDNNTLSVIFRNNDLLLGVVGEFNCNLKELERITGTNIYSRGNSILIKSEQKKNELNGDAIITNLKNVGIGILTADCAPILFHDPKKKIIGCIHSGWKGALEGIIKNTLKKLLKLECRTEDLIFAIGPCISKKNYEVGEEFYKKFIKKNKQNDLFFESKKNAKYLFDLGEFIRKELINLGMV